MASCHWWMLIIARARARERQTVFLLHSNNHTRRRRGRAFLLLDAIGAIEMLACCLGLAQAMVNCSTKYSRSVSNDNESARSRLTDGYVLAEMLSRINTAGLCYSRSGDKFVSLTSTTNIRTSIGLSEETRHVASHGVYPWMAMALNQE